MFGKSDLFEIELIHLDGLEIELFQLDPFYYKKLNYNQNNIKNDPTYTIYDSWDWN